VSGSRSTRVLVVLSGAALVGGALLSPLLSPALILPVSLLWYLALAVLLRSAYHILRSWTSKRVAAVLVGLTTALPVVLTPTGAYRALHHSRSRILGSHPHCSNVAVGHRVGIHRRILIRFLSR